MSKLEQLIAELCPDRVEFAETGVNEDEAFDKLYNSELYAALENEETKVWTYRVPKLVDLYQGEITTGKLDLPEY